MVTEIGNIGTGNGVPDGGKRKGGSAALEHAGPDPSQADQHSPPPSARSIRTPGKIQQRQATPTGPRQGERNGVDRDALTLKSQGCGDHLLSLRKVTIPQAAKSMGIGQTKLRELLGRGEIPVIRIMGKTLLLERDLEIYLQIRYGQMKRSEDGHAAATRLPRRRNDYTFVTNVSLGQ